MSSPSWSDAKSASSGAKATVDGEHAAILSESPQAAGSAETGKGEKMMIPIKLERRDDLVRVVRCKDCRYFMWINEKCELIDTRLHFYEADKTWAEDCFCAWGERR